MLQRVSRNIAKNSSHATRSSGFSINSDSCWEREISNDISQGDETLFGPFCHHCSKVISVLYSETKIPYCGCCHGEETKIPYCGCYHGEETKIPYCGCYHGEEMFIPESSVHHLAIQIVNNVDIHACRSTCKTNPQHGYTCM